MDRVRFGKALGVGTREAAKALARAADAALAPSPGGSSRSTRTIERTPHARNPPPPARRPAIPSHDDLRRGSKRFGESVFKPFAKASSVLWFEFTGSFFALFALAMGLETWKRRAELRPGVILNGHAWLAPVLLLIFGYFTVSSFLNASRRSRR